MTNRMTEASKAPPILSLRGAPALSPFRRDKLLAEMRARVPAITGVTALYWHFVALDGELKTHEQTVLARLLTYGPRADAQARPGGELLLVVPRLGTISPWSTKATDIAHCCGLKQIRRIERGVAWYLIKGDGIPLAAFERESLVPLIHDRMVENVLPDLRRAIPGAPPAGRANARPISLLAKLS